MVLVDEYQDTKQIQYEILASILRAGGGLTRLFMVGDPNQAIYGSLGGYAISIGDLRQMTGLSIAERALSKNYRSSERLVSYFRNFCVESADIRASGAHRTYPSLVTYDRSVGRDELVHEIVRLIRHNVETLSVPAHQICILAPQWPYLASMTRSLVASLPAYEFNGPGMVPFARDVENFWYKFSRLALTEPSPAMYVRRQRWAREVINDLCDVGVDTRGLSPRDLLRQCNAVSVSASDGLTYLEEFFARLFSSLNIPFERFEQLRAHHVAFFESSVARIDRLQRDGVSGIGDVSFFRKVFQNSAGVTVSTIHGVKGAEFDVVIAYALLEGMVPHFSDSDGDRSARRLLYVIGSRARKNLHLFSETGRRRWGDNFYGPTARLVGCNFAYDTI
jgi:superfamily I DNA/RNA helicase